jgi:hypothetical protein
VTAFIVAWLVGTPVILGLAYWVWQRVRRKGLLKFRDRDDDVRIGMWVFAASWLLWFVGAAHAGIVRYIFPAMFFGAPFAAVMLARLTNGFDLRETFERMMQPLRSRNMTRQSVAAWLAFVLVLFYLPLTLSISLGTWSAAEGLDVAAATQYLNRLTPVTARIETYESPLFLELEREYHYPPDALHLELNKRAARLPASVAYDALAADPDYLVVGPTGRTWKLYEDVIAQGAFRHVAMFGQYEIFERVRE